jgi:hypothetical protein
MPPTYHLRRGVEVRRPEYRDWDLRCFGGSQWLRENDLYLHTIAVVLVAA